MPYIHAELQVAGQVYLLAACTFGFYQRIDGRGKPSSKAVGAPLHLLLDGDEGSALAEWASMPNSLRSGEFTFFSDDSRQPRRRLVFTDARCVHQHVQLVPGAGGAAHQCLLVLSAQQLELDGQALEQRWNKATKRYIATPLASSIKPTKPVLKNLKPLQSQVRQAARWTGGAGPDGLGDSLGKASGRRFDPDNCGGAIIRATWQNAEITRAGIEKIRTHVSRYGDDPDNQAMIERLENIQQGKLAVSDWDKRFYTHELREYERYQNMGIADGVDPGREVWNNAHTATLEDFGLSDYADDGSHNLYHPEI